MQSAHACVAGLGFVSVLLHGCGGSGDSTPTTTTTTSTTPTTTTNPWAHNGEEKGADPGVFETYVLALEFQPQWSQTRCDTLVREKLDSSIFAQSQMSVHGMWPNYERAQHDGYEYPTFCGWAEVCDPAQVEPEAEVCKLDPAQVDAFNTSQHWQKYSLEYAWGSLAQHEWAKHGSCASMVQQEYFSMIEEFVYSLAIVGGPSTVIEDNVGANVSYDRLQSMFSEGGYVALSCSDCRLTDAYYLVSAKQDPGRPDAHLMPDINKFLDYPHRPAAKNDCQLCTGGVHITNWTAEGCRGTETSHILV